MDKISATILVATYNHAVELKRTLLGLLAQTRSDFQTVVCEDGEDASVADVVSGMRSGFSGGLIHVRHPHDGFRKCSILNAGVRRAVSDYLIFIDADCIPHHGFIGGHLKARRHGHHLAGRRVEMGEWVTRGIKDDWITGRKIWRKIWFKCLFDSARGGGTRHWEAGVKVPAWWPARRFKGRGGVLLGCNFSCWKSDLAQINGFDEDFVTPCGGEDSDIERRFGLIGVVPLSVKHNCICYHQYHPVGQGFRDKTLFHEKVGLNRFDCDHGLSGEESGDIVEAG